MSGSDPSVRAMKLPLNGKWQTVAAQGPRRAHGGPARHSLTVTVLLPSTSSSNTCATSSFIRRMQPIDACLPIAVGLDRAVDAVGLLADGVAVDAGQADPVFAQRVLRVVGVDDAFAARAEVGRGS